MTIAETLNAKKLHEVDDVTLMYVLETMNELINDGLDKKREKNGSYEESQSDFDNAEKASQVGLNWLANALGFNNIGVIERKAAAVVPNYLD